MRTANESDVVAELSTNESALLRIAGQEFRNWMNSEDARAEFIMSCHTIQDGGATPAMVRYLMQYAFQQGYVTKAKERC